MAIPGQPANNVLDFPQRHRAGRQRVSISSNGIVVADNSPMAGFQHLVHQSQDRPEEFNANNRRQLADTQIDIFEQALRMQNPLFKLDERTKERIRGLAADPSRKSAADVIDAVKSATSTALPSNTQSDIDAYLKHHNISKEEYYGALAKVGAGMNPDQVMAAYRALRAKEASGTAIDTSNGYTSSNSSTYPGYGGTAFNNEQAAYTYSNANYGITRGVSNELYNIGVRSSAQVQQVVTDVSRIGLGSGKENPAFTNRVAVNVAKIRKLEGAKTDEHMELLRQDQERHAKINLAIKEAESRGDTAAVAVLKKQLEESHKATSGRIAATVAKPEARVLMEDTAKAARIEADRKQAEFIKKYGLPAAIKASDAQNSMVGTGTKVDESALVGKSDADVFADFDAATKPAIKKAEVDGTSVASGSIVAVGSEPDKTKSTDATVVADAGVDKDKPVVLDPKAKDTPRAAPVVVAQNSLPKPANPKV